MQVNTLLSLDNPANMFVTVFYGVLNTRTGQLEYCSCGHNPPWVIHPDGQLHCLDDSQYVALGVMEGLDYGYRTMVLDSGTSLVLFTDGITEAIDKNGQFFSDERLEAFLGTCSTNSSKEIVDRVIAEVKNFALGAPQSDDMTMLAVKMR